MPKKSLSLVQQMWLPVVVLISVIAIVATLSIQRTVVQIAETTALQERQQQKLDLAQDWRELSGTLVARTQAAALAPEGPLRTELQAAQAETLGRLDALPARFAKLAESAPERERLQALDSPHRELVAAVRGATQPESLDGLKARSAALAQAAEALVAQQQHQTRELREYMAGLRLKNSWTMVGVMALLCVLFAVSTAHLVRRVVRPIGRLSVLAETIGQGDLSQAVAVDRQDELGVLQTALARMRDALADMVSQTRQRADSVQNAASEIAMGNADLSQRTETTAAHVQRTTGAVSELGVSVRHTSDSAATANQLAQTAATVAREGGEAVATVVHTMDEIQASSRRIADITGVIDGIAFQTNILALNAAVEAARAGEQGRGFAVVAGEVRLLAQRSAEAAKEIKSLIGASVERVESGTRQVRLAGSTMETLVASVSKVSDVIGEISASSREQSGHLADVAGAMKNLDEMAQSNAALVEEGAAAAESLKDQAVKLNELVSRYRVR
jgi:methyl-accepting chemotaxis protein